MPCLRAAWKCSIAPFMTPWSVSPSAGCPNSAARAASPSILQAPSSSEYSEWTCRWTAGAISRVSMGSRSDGVVPAGGRRHPKTGTGFALSRYLRMFALPEPVDEVLRGQRARHHEALDVIGAQLCQPRPRFLVLDALRDDAEAERVRQFDDRPDDRLV